MLGVRSRSDLEVAREFASELAASLPLNLLRVSLFGSRARGDHRVRSDFDLMILLRDADRASRARIHAAAVEWELAYNIDLSAKILAYAEFSRLRTGPELFWQHFDRDELVLWRTLSTPV